MAAEGECDVIRSPFFDGKLWVIRPCVSSKIRLQDVVGATVGREKGLEPSKGVGAGTAPGA